MDAHYFNSHETTVASALSELQSIQDSCAVAAPQMTSLNYEYLIGAELRQAWGNYVMNSTLSTYNETATDTDMVLEALDNGAQAKGWCGAAGFLYDFFAVADGTPINFSASLAGAAMQRLERAKPYSAGMYFRTAQQAYDDRNYPVAIFAADYALVLNNGSAAFQTTPQLLNSSLAIAQNSTYGVWATEFAKESLFYINQSKAVGNDTIARSYAAQAYTTALLARQLGQDVKLIYDNKVILDSSETANIAMQNALMINDVRNRLVGLERLTTTLIVMVAAILSINIVLIAALIKRTAKPKTKRK